MAIDFQLIKIKNQIEDEEKITPIGKIKKIKCFLMLSDYTLPEINRMLKNRILNFKNGMLCYYFYHGEPKYKMINESMSDDVFKNFMDKLRISNWFL
jgi:hypothetical protein